MSTRVLHVVTSLTPGGMEELIVNLTNARNQRWPGSTSICCLDGGGELTARVEDAACARMDVDRTRFPWDIRSVRRIRDVASESGIDVLHSHNLAAQQYAALAALGKRVKHIYTQHGENPHNWGARDRTRASLLSLFTDRRIAVSDRVSKCMVPRRGITVVENGIEPHEQTAGHGLSNPRENLGIKAGVPVIGSVGRLARVKGYDRLISALSAMRERPKLVLIGDGPERRALESQVQSLDMTGDVMFVGYRRDARALLGAFDLFVLPSRTEGLSIALLEAMWAECPVLVTDVGENRAVIDHGAAGTLLPEDDSRWSEVISECMKESNSEALRDRVRLARGRVEERYMLSRTVDAYERIYNEEMTK